MNKLRLDGALFDDEAKFSGLDDQEEVENDVPNAPEEPEISGLSNLLMDLIKSELNAIQEYNGAIQNFLYAREDGAIDDVADTIIAIIKDIANEENMHVGQLEFALKQISPNASSISDGEEEAEEEQAQ